MEDFAGLGEPEAVARVGNQEGQRFEHARQILAGEATLHVAVGAHAHEYGIVFVEQRLHRHVAADLGIEAELDAHAFEHLAAAGHDGFFHLEFGDAEGKQAADFLVAVVHHRLHAVARQHVGAGETGGAGADHRDALAGRHDVRHVGAPAGLERFLGDVALDLADGHRAETTDVRPAADGFAEAVGVEGARAFAQPVLGADAAAHLGQRVGAVGELGGLEQAALGDELQPVRDVVVHRALPLAVGVAATEAAVGLFLRVRRRHERVDFTEPMLADLGRRLGTVAARLLQEMEYVTHRHAPTTTRAGPRMSSTRSSSGIRFGLTSQTFARVASKSASSALARTLPVKPW